MANDGIVLRKLGTAHQPGASELKRKKNDFIFSGAANPNVQIAQFTDGGWEIIADDGAELTSVTISATGASIDCSGWSTADIAYVESTIGVTSGAPKIYAWHTQNPEGYILLNNLINR